jgi:CAP12/Pycsar effector protein, TIR domain
MSVITHRAWTSRIFLGSSAKQAKLLQAIRRGLEDVADVEPWTTTFNPGRSTLDRLVELSQEVDFAAFMFAQDDWDHDGCMPVRAGVAPRQRGVRGRAVRRRTRHPAHVHPPRARFEATD